jgi:cell division protein FtsX
MVNIGKKKRGIVFWFSFIVITLLIAIFQIILFSSVYGQILNSTIKDSDVLFQYYSSVALTLFGITLIGGIFEKKKGYTCVIG